MSSPSQLPPIQNPQLRHRALAHRSYVNEHPNAGENNERLEFLGDAVLGFLVGELLYKKSVPEPLSEAQMTGLRSALVDETQLAWLAMQFGLGEQMRLGKGALLEGGRENPALLSDTFEAYIGAYYLDAGIEAVREFITPLFGAIADEIIASVSATGDRQPAHLLDSKNRFQQWSLAELGAIPRYHIVGESGPDHAKEFVAEVRVGDRIYGVGRGRRKQDAEKRAAEDALVKLGAT
ncbi:ribonuclease III [Lyngbya sp. CCY1209]|jgi:ribonuclease-3|uniref:ribonuclease III n=1 Tax=Lyngbya sp. CCY1209 TaxID=2886103 RepID=UPI002D20816B|nr:ribonuclease III [Lyngbya sp. CCY1209]MEB3886458.1 ribonuclease III [Lyngbya sp. CCY1209]